MNVRQIVKEKARVRLHQRRWVRISMASFAIVALVGFESFWRFAIKHADPVASLWISESPIVRKTVSEIKSMKLRRSWSNASFSFNGNKNGRLHYFVHGTTGDLDLLVLWRQQKEDAEPVIEKVQWIDSKRFDTIWP